MTFGAIAIVAFVGGQPVDDWLANYGRGTATLILSAIMFLSVVSMPFSEYYARASVAEEYWGTMDFRAINRRISLVWAGAVLVMGVGHLLAGFVDPLTREYGVAGAAQPSRLPDLILNWGVPIVMIYFAARYTTKTADAGSTPGSPHD